MEWTQTTLSFRFQSNQSRFIAISAILFILHSFCIFAIQAQDLPENLKFANGLYQQRRYDIAAEEYQKFLAENAKSNSPEVANATYALATCRLFLGQYAEARKAYDEFLAKSPEHPNASSAQFRVGETSYLMGDLPRAAAALKLFLDKAQADHPQRDSAMVYAGDVFLRQEKPEDAIAIYRKAIESYPTGRLTTRAVFGLGRALSLKGQHKEALEQFQKLQKTGGAEWGERAWYQIVLENLAIGQPGDAAAALAELQKSNPRGQLIPDASAKLAEAYIKTRQPAEARKWLEQLAKADPPTTASIQATSRLAGLMLEAKEGDAALALLEPVIQKTAGQAEAATLIYQSAEALILKGEKGKARERFILLADRNPQDTWADDARLRAADLALEARDFEAARSQTGQLLKDHPKSSLADDARLLQARVEAADAKHQRAVELLEPLARNAARADLKSSAAYQLALAYQALGQAEKAQALLATLSGPAMPAGSGEALLLLGKSSFESKKYENAADALEKYLKTAQPKLADHALSWLALSQWELGRKDAAGETVARLEKEFPKSPTLVPLLLKLGESAIEAKSFEMAAKWLQSVQILAKDKPTRGRALTDLGYLYTEMKRPDDAAKAFAMAAEQAEGDSSAGREATLAAARIMANSGKLDDALGQIQKLLGDEKVAGTPAHREAMLLKARFLSRARKPADAAAAYEQFAKTYFKAGGDTPDKELDQVLSEWAYALIDAGKVSEADTVFERLLRETPKSKFAAEARLNLAESAYAARKYKETCDWVAELVISPRPEGLNDAMRESAIYRSGRARMELKEWDAAGKLFDQLRAEFPKSAMGQESAFWLGEIAVRTDRPEEAIKLFDELLKSLDSKQPPAWASTAALRKVQALTSLKKWDEVLKATDELLKGQADTKNPELLAELNYARGRALQSTARFDDARKAFQVAVDARPPGDVAPKSQFMRGETYFHEKNYREALREFLKVDILHDSPAWQSAALLEAGKVYEQLNQPADAADLYERLLERFPREAAATEAKNRLGAVRATNASKGAKPAA